MTTRKPRSGGTTFAERFWSKVNKTESCWMWTGCQAQSRSARYGSYRGTRAHRIAYELEVGPIPTGLTIDHLCKQTLCVRPSHLEAVTVADNVLRGGSFSAVNAKKALCPKGHPYDYVRPGDGRRDCRRCKRERYQRWFKSGGKFSVRERDRRRYAASRRAALGREEKI